MFKKLLNVGKGHSSERLQQQQQQQKNLFQLNEIKSYGFSHFVCLGYSASLSLLAVGSKTGLLRVFGNPSVEFNYQFENCNAIRQVEFIDCRETTNSKESKQNGHHQQQQQSPPASNASAKLVVLTDNGQLHLFELKTLKQLNFADNTTQTDGSNVANNSDCCQQQQDQQSPTANDVQQCNLEYTKLEYVGVVDYFLFKLDDDDRSKRVTTLEISANKQIVLLGTEGGNLYQIPVDKFEPVRQPVQQQSPIKLVTGVKPLLEDVKEESIVSDHNDSKSKDVDDCETAVNLNDEPQIEHEPVEPFEMIKFDEDVVNQIGDDVKPKKQGAIESIKRHPASDDKLLLSYHRGLSVIYDIKAKRVDKYFYHNQILESSCFGANNQNGDFFFTSHNDGSYIRWDTKRGSQSKADDDYIGQLYGPYPCKPTPKIQACTGLLNDQTEDLIIFSGGMPRATYDDKNPVTIVRTEPDGKDTIKTVLDFTSKVLDFVVITRPRGNLGAGAKATGGGGGGGKKNKNKQQQQQQKLSNQPIAVALAILAEEEFAVIDLLNSDQYLEFPLPYLNCVQPSAITCNQHYSDISDELYDQLLTFNRQQLKGKLSQNEWPITGGKVIEAPEVGSHDILLTGHEDGSVNLWDVSELSMKHLLHLPTARFFSTEDDDLVPIDGDTNEQENNDNQQQQQDSSAWPPLKRIGRFDPYSDDTRLAIRKISLCPKTGTLLIAGTGGQVLVFELKANPSELSRLQYDEVTLVTDQRFTWKGREKLEPRPGVHKFEPGYQLTSYVQLNPPASATSTDLRPDWHLFAVGTSYGFLLYDYVAKHSVVNRCTLNVQDFAIVSGDAGAMSRKKSFRKSLRESFRRLRRGRSQRTTTTTTATTNQTTSATAVGGGQATGLTGGRSLAASNDTAQQAAAAHRNLYSGERQVEVKVELSSIIKCITLTSAVITNNPSLFKPSLWVGTNSGQLLVYAIDLASEQQQVSSSAPASSGSEQAQAGDHHSSETTAKTSAKVAKEVQLKHRAPIIAIFTSPEAPVEQTSQASAASATSSGSAKSTPEKQPSELFNSKDSQDDRKSQTAESEANEATSEQQQQAGSPVRAQTPQQGVVDNSNKSPSRSFAGSSSKDQQAHQARVLICSEEQFKVFNLPNMKPFCKFKLTAHEGLRAKKVCITQFLKPQQQHQQPLGNTTTTVTTAAAAASATKASSLSISKSSQSFATQTSPPASPVPPGESSGDKQQQQQRPQANGAQGSSSAKQSESNNNSLLALNNNHHASATTKQQQQDQKELMNAKFGAKASGGIGGASPEKVAAGQTGGGSDASFDGQEASGVAGGHQLEPYMVCMSNQGDCAIYSVPELKRQAQIQVCKREDVNGITSAMLTNYGEGYYLKSSSNFLRFSISSQRVLRVLSVV